MVPHIVPNKVPIALGRTDDSIVLRVNNPVIVHILPFVLNTDAFWDFSDLYSDGTMSKRLSPTTLTTYEFDLPNEDELEKFADLLWAANDTRESYQALLRQTDELVKSQFIPLILAQSGEIAKRGRRGGSGRANVNFFKSIDFLKNI